MTTIAPSYTPLPASLRLPKHSRFRYSSVNGTPRHSVATKGTPRYMLTNLQHWSKFWWHRCWCCSLTLANWGKDSSCWAPLYYGKWQCWSFSSFAACDRFFWCTAIDIAVVDAMIPLRAKLFALLVTSFRRGSRRIPWPPRWIDPRSNTWSRVLKDFVMLRLTPREIMNPVLQKMVSSRFELDKNSLSSYITENKVVRWRDYGDQRWWHDFRSLPGFWGTCLWRYA